MRRRTRIDALTTIAGPAWLHTTSMWGETIDFRALVPPVDKRAVLTAEVERMRAEGWQIDEEP